MKKFKIVPDRYDVIDKLAAKAVHLQNDIKLFSAEFVLVSPRLIHRLTP